MLKKKPVIVFIVLISIVLAGSIWWGGRDIWRLAVFTPDLSSANLDSEKLIEELKKTSTSPYAKFNLAVVQYRNQNYTEAKALLNEILNEANIDEDLSLKAHYNLGNTLYRLSEKETTPERTLELLKSSLMNYRIIIDAEKQKASLTDTEVKKDKDAHFNFALVRNRIKLLNDALRKKQQEQTKHQQLYQLLKSLKLREQQIADQLDKMKKDPYGAKSIEQRKELLELRKENNQQLQIIKEKLLKSLSQT